MKSIKDFTWKYWLVIYIVFMVLLSLASSVLKRYDLNIHATFIFTTVLLLHFMAIVKNQEGARMKHLIMAFIVLIIIQTTVSEFYGRPLTIYKLDIIKTALLALLLIFVVGFVRNKLKDRKMSKEKISEVVSQAPKVEEVEMLNPEDVPEEKPKEEEDAKTEVSR